MNIALFDFDGTISSRDSFLLFLWTFDRMRFLRTCLVNIPPIVLYLCGRFPNQRLKEIFLFGVFKNCNVRDLDVAAEVFCAGPISQIIRGGFWERLSYHQQRNHDVFVVTATPRFILEPWCVRNGIRIIGSELRYTKEGLVTGTLDGRNCMGQEKVDRVRNKVDLSKYETVYAYGDTSGDLPMLNLAPPENRYYKPFRS